MSDLTPTTEPAATPAPTPAAPSPEEQQMQQIADLNTPEDIENFISRAPQPAPDTPAPAEPETTPTAEPLAPAATPAPAPTTEPAPDTPAPADDTAQPGDTEKTKRFRVRTDDPVEAEAFKIKQRNPDLSLDECLARAKATQTPTNQNQPSTTERTSAKAKDELAQKIKAHAAASSQYETDKAAALMEEILNLRDEVQSLTASEANAQKQKETDTQRQEEARYNATFDASLAKSKELYDFVSQPDSAQAKRMKELDDQFKEQEDDLYFHPNKPLIIAQMVAGEFGIQPKTKSAPPAPATAVPPATPPATPAPATAPATAVPAKPPVTTRPLPAAAPGAATTASPAPAANLEASINSVQSIHDLERLGSQLGIDLNI